jgi:hypothetical protein
VAYITDELSIKRILDHLGLSPPEEAKPPPTREVVRVPKTTRGARSRPVEDTRQPTLTLASSKGVILSVNVGRAPSRMVGRVSWAS